MTSELALHTSTLLNNTSTSLTMYTPPTLIPETTWADKVSTHVLLEEEPSSNYFDDPGGTGHGPDKQVS